MLREVSNNAIRFDCCLSCRSSETLNAAVIPLHVLNNPHKEGILSPPMTQFDDQDEEELSPLVPRQFENTPSFDVGTPTATSRSHTTATTTSSANPYPYPLLPTSYTFPSYSFPDYTYPTYSFPDYTYPTYSYPDYTYPTYSYPDYTYPTYSYPDYTYPTYSYPTPTFDSSGSDSGFGGGGSSSTNFKLPKVRKVNVKAIVGAVVGSVSGVLALIGGIWAGMKRRARKALRMQQQQDQTREAEQRVPFMQGNSGGGGSSGGLGHTPSMSQMSSTGALMNNPHTPQVL